MALLYVYLVGHKALSNNLMSARQLKVPIGYWKDFAVSWWKSIALRNVSVPETLQKPVRPFVQINHCSFLNFLLKIIRWNVHLALKSSLILRKGIKTTENTIKSVCIVHNQNFETKLRKSLNLYLIYRSFMISNSFSPFL